MHGSTMGRKKSNFLLGSLRSHRVGLPGGVGCGGGLCMVAGLDWTGLSLEGTVVNCNCLIMM
jgi:hypothetical protein